jgi:superfamily II DNA/RNA helicase
MHRIIRTGRADATGTAIRLVLHARGLEIELLMDI